MDADSSTGIGRYERFERRKQMRTVSDSAFISAFTIN